MRKNICMPSALNLCSTLGVALGSSRQPARTLSSCPRGEKLAAHVRLAGRRLGDSANVLAQRRVHLDSISQSLGALRIELLLEPGNLHRRRFPCRLCLP